MGRKRPTKKMNSDRVGSEKEETIDIELEALNRLE